jgi:tetraacyldisaccharide 4'-kinase
MSSSLLRLSLLPLAGPASWLYGSAVGLRNKLYDGGFFRVRQLPVPVVSVGNLTVGGSGKTPLVAHISRYFLSKGQAVAVLSRGYRRRDASALRMVSDGKNILVDVTLSGDEPMELAVSVEGLAVAVGADRYRAGLEVIRRVAPRVFVMDDGFQHRRLYRDLDLVCIDAAEPVENFKLLPAGRLRERLRGLNRAGALVWTGWKRGKPSDPLVSRILGVLESEIPVFRAVQNVVGFTAVTGGEETLGPKGLDGEPVGLLAAMAKPGRFKEALEDTGAEVVWYLTKRDHYGWHHEDVERSVAKAKKRGARAVITTGKDSVKLGKLDELSLPLYRMDLRTEVLEREAFETLLDSTL